MEAARSTRKRDAINTLDDAMNYRYAGSGEWEVKKPEDWKLQDDLSQFF